MASVQCVVVRSRGAARLQARNGRCPACTRKGICLIRASALSSASLRLCGMTDRVNSASIVFTEELVVHREQAHQPARERMLDFERHRSRRRWPRLRPCS